MAERTRMCFRAPEDIEQGIVGFAAENSLSKSDAILALLRTGLAVERDGPYVSELAKVVRDTMRAELGAFGRSLEDRQEALSESMAARVDSAAGAGLSAMLASIRGSVSDLDGEASALRSAGLYMLYGLGASEAVETAGVASGSRSDEEADTSLLWG